MNDRSDLEISPRLRQDLFQRLGKKRSTILWTGVIYLIVGLVGLLFPIAASWATTIVIGWLFIVAGVMGVFHALPYHGDSGFFGAILWSLLSVIVGVYMVFNQGLAMVVLTIVIASIFIVQGAFQAATAFEIKPADGWAWALVSAVVSIGAGILIVAGMPGTSLIVLGILIGVNFFMLGLSMVMIARRLPKPVT